MARDAIAVLGGTFDPPHVSHLAIARLVLEHTGCTLVLLVPCIRHPFGKDAVPFEHRLEMCRLVAGDAGDGVEVSDIEGRRGLSGRTIDMLEALAGENPGTRLRLVVGADILGERDRWHRFGDIEALAEPILVAREGFDAAPDALPAPPPVSSSEIRRRIASGAGTGDLVTARVLEYIERYGLYGSIQP